MAYFFIIRRNVLIAFFETFNIVRDNAIDSNTLKKLDITVESMAQLKIMKIENTAILKKKAISLNLSVETLGGLALGRSFAQSESNYPSKECKNT